MENKKTVVALLSFLFLFLIINSRADAMPHVQFPSSDAIVGNKDALKDLEAFYGKLEDALAKKDLGALMTFYADDYFHNGMTKETIKSLWSNIFKNFNGLNSIHVFSSIEIQGSEAVITCTGTLLGVPKDSKDNQNVAVDRWINQNHWLSKKGGSWQIVGGATHWVSETKARPGKRIEYQVEFHPLF